MTQASETELSGEARLKARRNRFLAFCAGGFAVAVAVGFGTGLVSNMFAAGTLPAWSLFLAWGLALASFVWFSLAYFRRVDEVDLLDNLWSSMIGFYFYAMSTASWWLFHDMGLTPEINHIAIFAASFLVACIAYGLRKLGLR